MESGTGLDVGGVGSIVWVRRRNGSWWPGKILGPEELPASHLASLRTGTPVKLLGREDASVDWYNLEKSKRVKAFRCGEFDDCIERAESSQGLPPKKREKYARREDAILHALELEKELLRKQGNLDGPSNARSKSSGYAKKDSCCSDISNGKPGNTKSNQSRCQETPIKGEKVSSPVHLQKDKPGNQPSSENDHSEIIPRMRGLQYLGLKPACAKQKVTSFAALDVDDTPSPSTRVSSMGRTTHIKGGGPLGAILRAKRSRCMYFPPESFDALEYKEIPQNQIDPWPSPYLECNSPPRMLLNEDDTSELLEDVESGSSESSSSESESDSDSSETEPDMDEDITSESGATVSMDPRFGVFQRLDAVGGGSIGQGESDESSLSGEMSHFYPLDPLSVNEAVSTWQLKGKRNVRNMAKRSIDAAEIRGYDGSAHGLYPEERVPFRKRLLGQSHHRNHDFDDDVDVAGMSANGFGAQMFGFGGTGSLYMPRDSSRNRNSFNRNIRDWEGMPWEDRAAVQTEWENKVWHFDPKFSSYHNFGGKRRSMLIDADLKVQASYQKEPVPMVSLMSKLDGNAIIGHPIQIEALDDNSTETLLSTNYYFSNGLMNHGLASLLPAWRTAKRTNFRVPRVHRPFALGSYEAAEYHSLDDERKPPFKKYNTGSSNYNTGLFKTSISHVPGSPTDRQLPKKESLFSSQKTRTLPSFGMDHNLSSKSTHDSSNCQMDGLIKQETSGPTTVACIPVKLVFSRLLEKINRPPSQAPST